MDISATTQGSKQAGDLNKIRKIAETVPVQQQDSRNRTTAQETPQTGPLQNTKSQTGAQTREDKKQEKPPSTEEVEKTTRELNSYMDELKTSLGFSINEKTKELMVNIINRDTKEIIKQIPPEELMTIREKMAELAGILLNERV